MRERLRTCLRAHCPDRDGGRSDLDLNPTLRGRLPTKYRNRRASVLIPIRDSQDGASVLLTRRCAHLPDHAGQISFPGGSREGHDRDEVATALREAEEEIGLTPDMVEVVGRIDTYDTSTGFKVTPVVGMVAVHFRPIRDPNEVDEVFEVPLEFVLDRANHELHSREWLGEKRQFYAIPYDGYYIWGATAAMLVNLADVVDGQAQTLAGE